MALSYFETGWYARCVGKLGVALSCHFETGLCARSLGELRMDTASSFHRVNPREPIAAQREMMLRYLMNLEVPMNLEARQLVLRTG